MGEQELITLIVAMFASTGFWAFARTVYEHICEKKREAKNKVDPKLIDDIRNALLGVMHTMIFSLGHEYLAQDEITLEQYDNFFVLYNPYEKLGGNGTGKRLKDEIVRRKLIDEHTPD